eukprot:TRINITY_DN13042_c0_g1_i1.p1 TRINITY_DN13042_c0_g1~~TRINITY_DN13042_c0_g1_i1.p1  ORF type:complete len:613 (+),score=57.03 TRINITY_DN13042_c0_g1_i1:33-1871(+)
MELLGLVLAPVMNTARRKIRLVANEEDEADGLRRAMQSVAMKCVSQADHIQDAVERIQAKEFLAARSWMEQGIAAIKGDSPERLAECMAKAENEAQLARHSLPCKTPEQCRALVECYSILITSGFYSSSQGGANPTAGITSVEAYFKEITADARLKRVLSKAAKSSVYISEEEERLLLDAVRLEWLINERMSVRWSIDDEKKKEGWKARLMPSTKILGVTDIGGHARHVLRKSILQLKPTKIDLPPDLKSLCITPCTDGFLVAGYSDHLSIFTLDDGDTNEEETVTDITCTEISVSPVTGHTAVYSSPDNSVYIYTTPELECVATIALQDNTECPIALTWCGALLCIAEIPSRQLLLYNEEGEYLNTIETGFDLNMVEGSDTGSVCCVGFEDEEGLVEAQTWRVCEGKPGAMFSLCRDQVESGGDVACCMVGDDAWVLFAPSKSVHLASKRGGVLHLPCEGMSLACSGNYLCTGCGNGSVFVWESVPTEVDLEYALVHVLETGFVGGIKRMVGSGASPWVSPCVLTWGDDSSEENFGGLIDEASLLSKVLHWPLTSVVTERSLTDTISVMSPSSLSSSFNSQPPSIAQPGKQCLRERAATLFTRRPPSGAAS